MIIILLVIDQLIKWAAIHFKPSFELLGDILKIDYVENTGTIFGFLEGNNTFFIVLAIILCLALSLFMKKYVIRKTFKEKSYMLILSGGLGNLIDRIFRGFVIDYVSLKWVGIFNLSDIYIIIGIILVFIIEIRELSIDDKDKKRDFFRG